MAGPQIRPGGPGKGPKGPFSKPKNVKRTLRRLWGYISADMPLLMVVIFCVITHTIATLTGSYMLRPVINSIVSGNSSVDKLLRMLLLMAGVYVIAIVTQYIQTRIMINISQKALVKLRNDLFERMQRLPVRFHDTNSHGDLMSRFTNDVDAVGEMVSNTIVQLIAGVL